MKKLLSCALVLTLLVCACASAMAADLVIYSARNERLNNIVIPAFLFNSLSDCRFSIANLRLHMVASQETLAFPRMPDLFQYSIRQGF